MLELVAFNLIDALLALIVILGAWVGWTRGFVVAGLQLFTLVGGVVLAFLAYRYPAVWLQAWSPALDVWAAPLSFLATFVLACVVLAALSRALARAMPGRLHAHPVNRAFGLAPGIVRGLVNAAIVSAVLLNFPLLERVSTMARDSVLAGALSAPAEWLEARLAPIFEPVLRRTLRAVTVPLDARSVIELPFTVTRPKVRLDLEARMLEMVNAERTAQGLRPLDHDPALAEVARAHSRDMLARGYFSHVSPDGQELSHRMRQAKVSYLVVGENLALAPTLAAAHQGLMNSPGHRANVLRPQFRRLGVGVLDGGRHGLMITQNFSN